MMMIIIIIIIGYIEKRRRKNIKREGGLENGVGKDPCDNEREIEKETGIQRSKSVVNDVQVFTLAKETFISCL